MAGALQGARRVKGGRQRVLQILANHCGLEENLAGLEPQKRDLAERGKAKKPIRLVIEINIHPLVRDVLFSEGDRDPLHIGAEVVADECQCGHG